MTEASKVPKIIFEENGIYSCLREDLVTKNGDYSIRTNFAVLDISKHMIYKFHTIIVYSIEFKIKMGLEMTDNRHKSLLNGNYSPNSEEIIAELTEDYPYYNPLKNHLYMRIKLKSIERIG